MKFLFLFSISFLFTVGVMHAQIGINTESPQASLDIQKTPIDSYPDGLLLPRMAALELNEKKGSYGVEQNGVMVYITNASGAAGKTQDVTSPGFYYYNAKREKWIGFSKQEVNESDTNIYNADGALSSIRSVDMNNNSLVFDGGHIGIGVGDPINKLHIVGENPLRIEGVSRGSIDNDSILVVDNSGVIKTIGLVSGLVNETPTPAIALFQLNYDMSNFLNNISSGNKQNIPMVPIKMEIDGMELNANGDVITFPPGTYQITLIYDATHNAGGCTLSSYFVDFPMLDTGVVRVHSNMSHTQGAKSQHGGNITFAAHLTKKRTWRIALGRGDGGNCTGTGMSLKKNSTQLLVNRIGD